jgi:ADP-dependent NAD(P)H-hydrate dehydratase / NAD(P)H-hydrate epimerase
MKFFTSDKIKAADAYTIVNEPVASINLMERAAEQLADWLGKRLPKDSKIKFFIGPGNNGGDGLALARILYKRDYSNMSVFLLKSDKLSSDAESNRKRLLSESHVPVNIVEFASDFPEIDNKDFLIDGLFGTGLSRPLNDLAAKMVQYINGTLNRGVFAIDMPSGLFGENNEGNNLTSIIKASDTLSFEFPKLSFFFAENSEFVGIWHVLPIGIHSGFIAEEPTQFNYITEKDVIEQLKIRKRFSHKGSYGHALLIAGSYGMMGAAVLSAKAAVRSGAGLVTTHVPITGVETMQSAVPESLLSIDKDKNFFTGSQSLLKYSAVGIGPGLNKNEASRIALEKLLAECKVTMVIDADAINILSEMKNGKDAIPAGSILTPHPKEFERLFGTFPDSYARLEAQISFSKKKKCIIILKGAHTCITTPEGKVWYNTTGNPGMATGGSGDVLTGLILGLVAQGYSASSASILGVYIHGSSGDLAANEKGEHGLIASDIIDNIGTVFNVLEKKKLRA